jgi:hypothetical protein
MYGTLIQAFIEAIRAFPAKKRYGLNVVQVNDSEAKTVINTALPCAAVALINAKKPTTFIGGGIYENPKVNVQVIVDFVNHSSSADGGVSVKYQNLPYEIRRYVEAEVNRPDSAFFKELRSNHGFSAVYDEMKTYTSQAYEKEIGKQVLVYSFSWVCNMVDPCSTEMETAELDSIDEVILEDVELNDVNVTQNG